jgi:hypothetical protein
MCSVCLSIPCHPRCPNAPEPKPVHRCNRCGEGIYAGQKYFCGPHEVVCESCIGEMTAMEFMELTEEELITAETED